MSGLRLVRLVERMCRHPELGGFGFEVERENIRVSDPNGVGKSQLFDFDDAKFLIDGLDNKCELDEVDKANKIRFAPVLEAMIRAEVQKAEPPKVEEPRVYLHQQAAIAAEILQQKGWSCQPASQLVLEEFGVLVHASRKTGLEPFFECPECHNPLDRKNDGSWQYPYEWEAGYRPFYIWGCPSCGATGTDDDLPKVDKLEYRDLSLDQCIELVNKTPKLHINTQNGDKRRYGEKALESALAEVAALAGTQGRNSALNKIAFSMGRLLEPCGLSYEGVKARLVDAALAIGLKQTEMATVDSGLKSGMKTPKEL